MKDAPEKYQAATEANRILLNLMMTAMSRHQPALLADMLQGIQNTLQVHGTEIPAPVRQNLEGTLQLFNQLLARNS